MIDIHQSKWKTSSITAILMKQTLSIKTWFVAKYDSIKNNKIHEASYKDWDDFEGFNKLLFIGNYGYEDQTCEELLSKNNCKIKSIHRYSKMKLCRGMGNRFHQHAEKQKGDPITRTLKFNLALVRLIHILILQQIWLFFLVMSALRLWFFIHSTILAHPWLMNFAN